MYKVKFDTSNFKDKKRKDWEDQLRNDFAIFINGKEFICKTELDLLNRLSFIAGNFYSEKNKDTLEVWNSFENDKNNFFELTNNRYGTQRLKYGMYGIAQGYVDFDKVLEKVNEEKEYLLPFNHFYDLRQGNFFKNCFIKIEKI